MNARYRAKVIGLLSSLMGSSAAPAAAPKLWPRVRANLLDTRYSSDLGRPHAQRLLSLQAATRILTDSAILQKCHL
jgi:hypothetical protein